MMSSAWLVLFQYMTSSFSSCFPFASTASGFSLSPFSLLAFFGLSRVSLSGLASFSASISSAFSRAEATSIALDEKFTSTLRIRQ